MSVWEYRVSSSVSSIIVRDYQKMSIILSLYIVLRRIERKKTFVYFITIEDEDFLSVYIRSKILFVLIVSSMSSLKFLFFNHQGKVFSLLITFYACELPLLHNIWSYLSFFLAPSLLSHNAWSQTTVINVFFFFFFFFIFLCLVWPDPNDCLFEFFSPLCYAIQKKTNDDSNSQWTSLCIEWGW